MAPLVGFPISSDKNLKEKISFAIRQIEIQRKDIEQMRFRLNERRRTIFNSIVRAYEQKDDLRAKVFSSEHAELQKVARVVNASELALLHIVVRLETLRDVGDVMYALSNAFREVKRIGKSIENLAPNLEAAADEVNNAFSNILSELSVLTPNVSLALTDTPQEIFAKAQQLVKEKTSELSELPKSMEDIKQGQGASILEKTRKIALLASGEFTDGDNLALEEGEFNDDEEEFKPEILNRPEGANSQEEEDLEIDPERAVRNYIYEQGNEKIDVLDCSAQLNLPVDLVEQAYIKLLSERKPNASSKQN
jgi:division protein CdvB (Snf7/Vps24/ESCRT-III family)